MTRSRPRRTINGLAAFSAALAGAGAAGSAAEALVVNLTASPSTSTAANFTMSFNSPSANAIHLVNIDNNNTGSLNRVVHTVFGAASFRGTGSNLTGTVSAASIATNSFQNTLGSGFTAVLNFAFEAGIGSQNAGWYRLRFQSGTVSFIEGAYNTMGQPIRFGETAASAAVPVPASLPLAGLGVLALGAAGLRRRRARGATA